MLHQTPFVKPPRPLCPPCLILCQQRFATIWCRRPGLRARVLSPPSRIQTGQEEMLCMLYWEQAETPDM